MSLFGFDCCIHKASKQELPQCARPKHLKFDEESLSKEENQKLSRFRLLAGAEAESARPEHLIRFLRARKWDLEAALQQYRETQRWRKENDVDRFRRNALGPFGAEAAERASHDSQLSCMNVECFPQLRLVRPRTDEGIWLYYGRALMFGFDKKGHPIYIQQTGQASRRFPAMLAYADKQQIFDGYVAMLEAQQARMEESSERLGRAVTKQVVINDMRWTSYTPDPRTFVFFREFVKISSTYYPETLAMQFFINVPSIFVVFWRLMSKGMDPVTLAKTHILGTDFKSALLQHIDADQLLIEYGGTNDFDALSTVRTQLECENFLRQFQSAAESAAPRVPSRSQKQSVCGVHTKCSIKDVRASPRWRIFVLIVLSAVAVYQFLVEPGAA